MNSDLTILSTQDDPEVLDGLPCAIQVVAPRFHDEKCLAISKIVDAILNKI